MPITYDNFDKYWLEGISKDLTDKEADRYACLKCETETSETYADQIDHDYEQGKQHE